MTNQIGIDTTAQKEIVASLKVILAESIWLYSKTQNIHWNITGPLFHSVHTMTEEQYLDLATAIDDIAERIRALGEKVPSNIDRYRNIEQASCNEHSDAADMLSTLVSSHENISSVMRQAIITASDASDEVTAGLLTDRLMVHEKTAWILRASIG